MGKSRKASEKMPKFRLVYFNLRGRAEPIRWILEAVGQPYEDERFDKEEEWANKKKEIQYEKVPILFVDDKPLSQSVAICRYLGHIFNLCAEDPWMSAIGDEVADAVHDFLPPAAKILYARMAGNHSEAQTLAEEFNGVLKATLTVLEGKLANHNWFCGEKMTWVDLFAACYISQLSYKNAEAFTNFPKVKSHFERVVALPQIQKWIKERPETPL